jgi:thiol:disulfide interchange protein DsbG
MQRRPLLLLPAALALAACGKPADVSNAAPSAAPNATPDAATAQPGIASPSTAQAASAAAPSGTASATDALALAAQGHGFTVGVAMAAQPVYVFFDAACPHCAQLWTSAKPLLNRIKMVWMPVGILRATSGPQGATILSASDPAAAMDAHEASGLAKGPGIAVDAARADPVMAQVKKNTELFNQLGADSVPFIVFRQVGKGAPATHAGALDTAGLSSLLGL